MMRIVVALMILGAYCISSASAQDEPMVTDNVSPSHFALTLQGDPDQLIRRHLHLLGSNIHRLRKLMAMKIDIYHAKAGIAKSLARQGILPSNPDYAREESDAFAAIREYIERKDRDVIATRRMIKDTCELLTILYTEKREASSSNILRACVAKYSR